MADTAISWTHRPGTRGRTWNPVRGCRNKSEGCRNCYAKAQAARIIRMGRGKPTPYDGLVRVVGGEPQWTGEIAMDAARLAEPLRWRDPSTVFVDSMSDLFYDARPDQHIAAVFGVMAACPQHTFLVLTKYAARMREWFEWVAVQPTYLNTIKTSPRLVCRVEADKIINPKMEGRPLGTEPDARGWPLPNVWIGVSVENQDAADERIPDLLDTPAALRFLSCEPLIGAVDITEYLDPASAPCGESNEIVDWVIAGCESGPGARPCDVAWLRSLRDQCSEARVPFFLKQANARDFVPQLASDGWHPTKGPIAAGNGSRRKPGGVIELPYLDGFKHSAFPKVSHG